MLIYSEKMKRLLYIVLAVALFGCQQYEYTLTLGDIEFCAAIASRNSVTQGNINNESTTVILYGVQNSNNAIYDNTPLHLDTAGNTGKWIPEEKNNTRQQWKAGSSYIFHAYAYNTTSGLTITKDKDGLEIQVDQPKTYNRNNPNAMVDYLLSYSFKVADGSAQPIVQLQLEHAMSAVEIYVVKGNNFDARLDALKFEGIYSAGTMKCTSQAIANSGERNVWDVSPSGNNSTAYELVPAANEIIEIGDSREETAAKMSFMCLPQQLTANTKLTITYQVNEVTADNNNNYVQHVEEFYLYNYSPMVYQSGHRVIYTITVDSGVNIEGTVSEWKDVDYIEGTVLPEVK